jgi:hypothetical protein
MPQLSVNIPHKLSQEEAVERIKTKLAAVKSEYQDRVNDFSEQWRDQTLSVGFQVLGMTISGSVAVEPHELRVAAKLPMAASFFRSTIEDRIRREVNTLLG